MSIKKHGGLNLCCVNPGTQSRNGTCVHTDTTHTHTHTHRYLPPLFKNMERREFGIKRRSMHHNDNLEELKITHYIV